MSAASPTHTTDATDEASPSAHRPRHQHHAHEPNDAQSAMEGAHASSGVVEPVSVSNDDLDEDDFGPARPTDADMTATAATTTTSQPAATPPSSSSSLSARRVKMYLLGETGLWQDRGTGWLAFDHVRDQLHTTVIGPDGLPRTNPDEPQFRFIVRSDVSGGGGGATTAASASSSASVEDAAVVLLSHAAADGVDYQIQNQTILTWSMVDTRQDYALSFQESAACAETWQLLTEQLRFVNPPPIHSMQDTTSPDPDNTDPAEATADMYAAAAAAASDSGAMDDLDGANSEEMGLSHELDSQNSSHLVEDYPDAPPVSIHMLDRLAQRLHAQQISRRELRELLAIWRSKEEEFRDLLDEERRDYADEQRQREAANAAAAAASAAANAVSNGTPMVPHSSNASGAAADSSLPPLLSPSSSSSTAHASPPLDDADSRSSSPSFSPIMETLSQLHALFRFAKSLLLTNDVQMFEVLFADDMIENLVGMLEYDPAFDTHPVRSIAPHDFTTHRTFLARAEFKFVVPFFDDIVLHKIHQNYKVTYLKDVVLARHLDDATAHTLTQIIFFNMMSIIQRLTEKKEFVDELFRALNEYAHVDPTSLAEERARAAALERQNTVLLTDDLNDALNASRDSMQSDVTLPVEPTPTTSATGNVPAATQSTASATSQQAPVASTSLLAAADSRISPPASPTPSSSVPPPPSLRTVLLFLQELVLMAKNVQVPVRDAFYKALDHNSLFEVLESILVQDKERQTQQRKDRTTKGSDAAASATPPSSSDSDDDASRTWVWHICTDIISNICIHDPSLFRTYLISAFEAPNSILDMMFRMFAVPRMSTCIAHQLSCLIRLVLDPESMSIQEQQMFLGHIYRHYLAQLLAPLRHLQPTQPNESPFEHGLSRTTNVVTLRAEAAKQRSRDAVAATYHMAAYHAIELLSYCALHHSAPPTDALDGFDDMHRGHAPLNFFRMFALTHRVLPTVINVLRTTRRNDIVCAAIRFFRICVGARDQFYTPLIVDENLLEPIFAHFHANGARYNLLNSVVCEMVTFFNETHRARDKNQPSQFNPNAIVFLRCIVRDFWTRFGLDRIQYVNTFQESRQICLEYEREEAERKAAAEEEEEDEEEEASSQRAHVSRTTHSILSDSEDEEEARVTQQQAQQAVAMASAAAAAAKERDGKVRLVTKRRKDRPSPPQPQREGEQKQGLPPASSNSLLSADYYDDLDADATHVNVHADPVISVEVAPAAGSTSLQLESYEDHSDDESHSLDVSYDDAELNSSGGGGVDDDTAEDAPTARRIVFISEQDGGGLHRQPLPTASSTTRRRSRTSKRKLDGRTADADSIEEDGIEIDSAGTASPAHLSPAAALPPPVSPSKQHNPYLHVAPSELPPTAQRSPELKAMLTTSPTSTSSSPSSPPRQVTPLDLADNADAASDRALSTGSASPVAISPQRSTSLSLSPLVGAHSPHHHAPKKTNSAPSSATQPTTPTDLSPQSASSKRRRLEST